MTAQDPYDLHFGYELPENVIKDYHAIYAKEKEMSWPHIGSFCVTDPSEHVSLAVPLRKREKVEEFSLKENLLKALETPSILKSSGTLSASQFEFFSIISDYFDLLYTNRTDENANELRLVYCLHILNHILKARAKIIHHNSKLSKNPDEEYRDQGFTRTTALILVPFKDDCYHIVHTLTTLLAGCDVMNKKRFETEYGSEKPHPRKKPKPDDYERTFAGNTEEDFKIGLKIKNKSICLYSDFYSSDLIIASPLGLRPIVGAEGDKERDFDFLSSIEILVLDRADAILMQNWYHLDHILKHLNLIPKESHDCNFFRVRMYATDGLAKFYRQTVLLSSIEHAFLKMVFRQGHCFNHAGYIQTWQTVKTPAICQVLLPMAQVFRWFDTELPKTDVDDRFHFFTTQILPQFKDPMMAQTMIYIPSYFDFVRLRNYFRQQEISGTMICEYSKSGKVAQARNLFFKGHRHFLLYTERAHFYNRYQIKGIRHVIFYQLPAYPLFYSEICNLLLLANPRKQNDWLAENSCTVIVSKFDCLQLKHIVGVNRTQHMCNSHKKVFMIRTQDK